jgi:hypothetical protein
LSQVKKDKIGRMKKLAVMVIFAVALFLGTVMVLNVHAFPITFAPSDYDNTANVVNSGPTPVNNQTTGLFRDVFWWSINNGQPRVGSPDFINLGNSLILSGNHAVPGPGPYTALNFTGPSISGGQSYLSIYDTTPADGTATRDLFDARGGGLTVSADVMFVKHNASGGVVALYNEGQDALALLANNRDGNNTDIRKLDLVWQSAGSGIVLASAKLPASSFVPLDWYRVTMDLKVVGNSFTVNGYFYRHVTGTDPTSALGSLITTLLFTDSLSDPDPCPGPSARVLTNPGEIGIIAMANESISLPDNVGVSVTNFQAAVPEPLTLLLLGAGLVVLSGLRRKFKN